MRAYDPVAMQVATRMVPEIELAENAYTLAEGCDALIVITEWNEFKNLDMVRIRELMNRPVLMDGRNIYDPAIMNELGFYYRGVGRGYENQEIR